MPLISCTRLLVDQLHDQADRDKEFGSTGAKSSQDAQIADLDAEITALQESFDEYEQSVHAQIDGVESAEQQDKLWKELYERQQSNEEAIQAIREKKRAVKAQFALDIESAEQAYKASMDAPLSAEDAQTWADANQRRDELLQLSIDGYFPDLRSYAVDSAIKELARRRPYFEKKSEEFAGYFDRLSAVLDTALESPYSDLVRHTALGLADHRFSNGYKVLLSMLNSYDSDEHSDAIRALVKLEPAALVQYTDANGNPYPRTASLLLSRLTDDEFGTIDSWTVFQAIGELRDRDSSVQSQLFAYLDKGTEAEEYDSVLEALIELTGYNSVVLEGVEWADITPSEFEELQACLPEEEDWEQVTFEKFVELYQSVYNDSLLGDIMENLLLVQTMAGCKMFLGMWSIREALK